MGIQLYIIGALLLALTFAGQQAMYYKSQQENAEQREQIAIDALESTRESIRVLTSASETQATLISNYSQRQESSAQATVEQSRELAKLRALENENALKAPFTRGNAATERRNAIFMRFNADHQNRGTEGTDSSGPAERAPVTADPIP